METKDIPLDLKTQSLLGYLPATVIKKIIDDKNDIYKNLPYTYQIKTVSLFADISGFTKLSMSFAKLGRIGPEFLAFSLNRYMEKLINIIGKNGGDIFKFAGDALLVIWPEGKNSKDSCERAVQCALEIQSNLHDVEISPDKKLSIKIGLGFGEVRILFVGGGIKNLDRSEYLIVGEAMRVACLSETLAVGGETVAHESLHELVKDFYSYEEAHSSEDHGYDTGGMKFYKIKEQKRQLPARADAYLMRTKFNSNKVREKLASLIKFVPRAISLYLNVEKEMWSREINLLTVMFLNLKIDLSHTSSPEGINRIQNIVRNVQRCVYMTKGSLNKFLMDDKGSVMLIVWGLPFISSVNDASRSVLSAIEITKVLSKHNCGAYMGITTGSCFTGVCGTVGGRREYSLLGEVVNLSARFMQQAIVLGQKTKSQFEILLDEKTKNLIQKDIACEWILENECKGFAERFQFYSPIKHIKRFYDNKIYFLPELRTNYNNYPIGKQSEKEINESNTKLEKSIFIVGRKIEVESIKKEISVAVKKNNKEIFLIRGVIGSGKTLFIKKFMHEYLVNNKELTLKHQNIKNMNNPDFIFISTQNPRVTLNNFNCFYSIFNKIISYFKHSKDCCLFKERKFGNEIIVEEDVIGSIIFESNSYSYKNYIEEIIDINVDDHIKILSDKKKFSSIFKTIEIPELDIFFEKRNYQKIDIILNFFLLLLRKYKNHFLNNTPLFMIIEDIHFSDKLSFEFMKLLYREDNLNGIIVIYSFKDQLIHSINDSLNVKFKINDVVALENVYIMDNINEYEDVSKLILFSLPDNLKSNIKEIDLELKNIILIKSLRGNPLLIINLLESIIKADLYVVDKDVMRPSKILQEMEKMRDFSNFPVPMIVEKHIGYILDLFTAKDIIILKYAAVIGNIFSLSVLYSMNEFNNLSLEDVNNILKSFEAKGILEVLYDLYLPHTVFKFAIPLCREVLYQRMLIEQKNEIHLNTARTMQSIKFSYLPMDEEMQVLKHHLKQSEKSLIDYIKDDNPYKNDKDVLKLNNIKLCVVKELQQNIKKYIKRIEIDNKSHQIQLIKKDFLEKKSDKKITWERRYFGVSINKGYYWYIKEDYEGNKIPLGYFDLKHVYNVEILPDFSIGSNKNLLSIHVAQWYKKDLLQGPRSYIFSFDSKEILHTWIITLNFLKLNVLYDEFSINVGVVTFPLFGIEKEEVNKIKSLKRKFNKHILYDNMKTTNDISLIYNSIARKSLMMNKYKASCDVLLHNKSQRASNNINIIKYEDDENNEINNKDIEFLKQFNKLTSMGFLNILCYIEDILFGIDNFGKSGYIHVPDHADFLKTSETDVESSKYIQNLFNKPMGILSNKQQNERLLSTNTLMNIHEDNEKYSFTSKVDVSQDEGESLFEIKNKDNNEDDEEENKNLLDSNFDLNINEDLFSNIFYDK